MDGKPLLRDEQAFGEGSPAFRRDAIVVNFVRNFYESARSKDTDLIKDMLPYMQHKEDCGINANPWTEDGSPGPECTCTCGLSELLQRINERSK